MAARYLFNALVLASSCITADSLAAGPMQHATQSPAVAPQPVKKNDAPVNADAAALADFKKRVDDYVALHRRVAKRVPPLKETNNPAEITHAQAALEQALSAARATAKPGDLFTPAVRTAFRKVLIPEMKGEDGHDTKAVMKDDAPTTVPLKVNAKYPESATRPTVPAAVLMNLPKLPEEVEYRFIEKHLILLDAEAGMVIDFIPNAIK